MASEYKVPLTRIRNIKPHPNAEKLEFAVVYDFEVIVQKNKFQIGDEMLYVPIDSILSPKLESHIFPESSKVKLHNSRIRQIKLRGMASQGLLISPQEVEEVFGFLPDETEKDYQEELGIKKYSPPVPDFAPREKKDRNRPLENPLFHKYNGISNIKYFPDLFANDEIVSIQEKLHGSLARCSMSPTVANTLWKKVLKFFGKLPEFEFCYGSNNVELTNRKNYTGFYGEDHYGKTLEKIKAKEKVKPRETCFFELIGEGLQKNYHYGHRNGEKHLVLYDVKILKEDGTFYWLNPDEVEAYAKERGFDMVPTLYRGPYNAELAKSLTKGNSVYCPDQKVREGVVIKSIDNYNDQNFKSDRKGVKLISEDFLDNKDNSDFQ